MAGRRVCLDAAAATSTTKRTGATNRPPPSRCWSIHLRAAAWLLSVGRSLLIHALVSITAAGREGGVCGGWGDDATINARHERRLRRLLRSPPSANMWRFRLPRNPGRPKLPAQLRSYVCAVSRVRREL